MDAQDHQAESLEGADEGCVVAHLGLVFLLGLPLLQLTDLCKNAEIKVNSHLT